MVLMRPGLVQVFDRARFKFPKHKFQQLELKCWSTCQRSSGSCQVGYSIELSKIVLTPEQPYKNHRRCVHRLTQERRRFVTSQVSPHHCCDRQPRRFCIGWTQPVEFNIGATVEPELIYLLPSGLVTVVEMQAFWLWAGDLEQRSSHTS